MEGGGSFGKTGMGPSVHCIRECSLICVLWKWSFKSVWENVQCIWYASLSRLGSPQILYKSKNVQDKIKCKISVYVYSYLITHTHNTTQEKACTHTN